MVRFWKKKSQPVKPDLPDDGELIAYLDGQLAPERQAEIEKLLEGSWDLRVRLAELERDIETYVEAMAHLLTHQIPPFDDVWKGAPAEPVAPSDAQTERPAGVYRLAAETNAPPLLSRFGLSSLTGERWRPRFAAGLAAGLLVTCFVVLLLTRPDTVPAVSAKELLQRTEQAEVNKLRITPRPVVYQKLRVRRTSSSSTADHLLTWEIWHDHGNDRLRQRVEDDHGRRFVDAKTNHQTEAKVRTKQASVPTALAELEQVFEANHVDARRPFSPRAYQTWRNSLRRKTEAVSATELPDGGSAWTLTTTAGGPTTAGAIVKTELVVRAADWHPVKGVIKVQAEQGEMRDYELTEIAFEVLALDALEATIFASPGTPASASATPAAAAVTPTPRATTSASPALLPGAAELTAAEIAARYALHRAGADLGEPVEVIRSASGRIEVRGLAENARRKQELLAALRDVPHIAVNILTVEEAARSSSNSPRRESGTKQQTPLPSNEQATEGQTADNQFQEKLARYLAAQRRAAASGDERKADEPQNIGAKVAEFSESAVSHSEAALAEAWALRRLAERYAAENMNDLRPTDRQRLEEMVRVHSTRLRARIRSMRTLVAPALAAITGQRTAAATNAATPDPQTPNDVHWSRQAQLVFDAVKRVDHLTGGLFAGAKLPAGQSGDATAQALLAALAQADGRLENLAREAGK